MLEDELFIEDDLVPELESLSEMMEHNVLFEMKYIPDFVKNICNTVIDVDKKMDSIIGHVDDLVNAMSDVNDSMCERILALESEHLFPKYDLSKYEHEHKQGDDDIFPCQETECVVQMLQDTTRIAFQFTTLRLFIDKLDIKSNKIKKCILSHEHSILSIFTRIYQILLLVESHLKKIHVPDLIKKFRSSAMICSENTTCSITNQLNSVISFSERRNNGNRMYEITDEFDPYY
jgi:hypothetical protein